MATLDCVLVQFFVLRGGEGRHCFHGCTTSVPAYIDPTAPKVLLPLSMVYAIQGCGSETAKGVPHPYMRHMAQMRIMLLVCPALISSSSVSSSSSHSRFESLSDCDLEPKSQAGLYIIWTDAVHRG